MNEQLIISFAASVVVPILLAWYGLAKINRQGARQKTLEEYLEEALELCRNECREQASRIESLEDEIKLLERSYSKLERMLRTTR